MTQGFVELRDVAVAVGSKVSGSHDARPETSVLAVVRVLDSYLNLRSVGKGLTLLKAWVPGKYGRGGARKKVGSEGREQGRWRYHQR